MPHTTLSLSILLAVVAVCLAVSAALAVRLATCQRGRTELAMQLKTLANTEKSAVRQLRLGSHNLRAIGMTLQGHAEHLEAGGAADIAGIAEAATGVFDIADYMHEWIQHGQTTNVLDEETLHLGRALDEAISNVSLKMQPGRRTWNVEPDVLAVGLRADRRAVRHVLTRALSVLVRGSGHDDTIRIRLESTQGAVALVIELQPGQQGHSKPTLNGGGPDLRLTLARELMEAHGGKFEVEANDRLGVRVRIIFPVVRVVKWSDEMGEPPTLEAAARATGDNARGVLVS
jgi:signal transduction histidine kinase